MKTLLGVLIASAVLLAANGVLLISCGFTSPFSLCLGIVLIVGAIPPTACIIACAFKSDATRLRTLTLCYQWSWLYVFVPFTCLLVMTGLLFLGGVPRPWWIWVPTIATCAFVLLIALLARYWAGGEIVRENEREPAADDAGRYKLPEKVEFRDNSTTSEQMKYAWAWFQYHADQRLKAFNFYLVFVSILAVAYSNALKEGLAAIAPKPTSDEAVVDARTMALLGAPPGPGPLLAASTLVAESKNPQEAVENPSSRNTWLTLAMVIGLIGCVVSGAFLLIEVRNTELVDAGRGWLDVLEKGLLGMTLRAGSDAGKTRPFLLQALGLYKGVLPYWKPGYSHAFALRAIYLIVGAVFVMAFGCALALYLPAH